jgi:hypothetical protein
VEAVAVAAWKGSCPATVALVATAVYPELAEVAVAALSPPVAVLNLPALAETVRVVKFSWSAGNGLSRINRKPEQSVHCWTCSTV